MKSQKTQIVHQPSLTPRLSTALEEAEEGPRRAEEDQKTKMRSEQVKLIKGEGNTGTDWAFVPYFPNVSCKL